MIWVWSYHSNPSPPPIFAQWLSGWNGLDRLDLQEPHPVLKLGLAKAENSKGKWEEALGMGKISSSCFKSWCSHFFFAMVCFGFYGFWPSSNLLAMDFPMALQQKVQLDPTACQVVHLWHGFWLGFPHHFELGRGQATGSSNSVHDPTFAACPFDTYSTHVCYLKLLAADVKKKSVSPNSSGSAVRQNEVWCTDVDVKEPNCVERLQVFKQMQPWELSRALLEEPMQQLGSPVDLTQRTCLCIRFCLSWVIWLKLVVLSHKLF